MFDLNIETTKETTVFNDNKIFDLLIVGAGPGGLNAGLYAYRKGLRVGIVTDEIGGQLHNTTTVDNYLGYTNIDGAKLSSKFLNHINDLDVPMLKGVIVNKIIKTVDGFKLHLSDGKTLESMTVILATGGAPRKLGIKGEATYNNKGISYCATCDAPFYKDQHVIVAGGGNAAAEGVLDLSAWAKKITVIHRSKWRADPVLLKKMEEIPNLTIHLNHQLLEVFGDDNHMQGVKALNKTTNETRSFDAQGLLIEIGTIPKSDLIKDIVETTDKGEVIVDENQMTSVEGLYAVGDVTQNPDKQIIIAAAEGAKAALASAKYINHKTKENS